MSEKASQIEYFECSVPPGDGRCSDNNCPCPEVRIPRGEGYLYISKEIVELRSKHRDEKSADLYMRMKLAAKQVMLGQEMPQFYSIGPILVCEKGAKLRNLNLKVASADDKYWWETGKVPFRPTPILQ